LQVIGSCSITSLPILLYTGSFAIGFSSSSLVWEQLSLDLSVSRSAPQNLYLKVEDPDIAWS
jgi:hypothetical protein